jgi:hypothetical protein
VLPAVEELLPSRAGEREEQRSVRRPGHEQSDATVHDGIAAATTTFRLDAVVRRDAPARPHDATMPQR